MYKKETFMGHGLCRALRQCHLLGCPLKRPQQPQKTRNLNLRAIKGRSGGTRATEPHAWGCLPGPAALAPARFRHSATTAPALGKTAQETFARR